MTALIDIVLLLPIGCERESPTDDTTDATAQAAVATEHPPGDGHNHAKDLKDAEHADDQARDHGEAGHNDHAGHEHGNGHGRSGHGLRHIVDSTDDRPRCAVVPQIEFTLSSCSRGVTRVRARPTRVFRGYRNINSRAKEV